LAPQIPLCCVSPPSPVEFSSRGVIAVSQDLDVGAAIEDLLIIWAPSDEGITA
jgi:hypothetical protein